MSHVSTIECEVNDLEALRASAELLGMELVTKSTFKWYGKHVGDYPLPEGFSKEDMGKCLYAIRIKGDDRAYEIGVVPRRDSKPGYVLLWDFWCGGKGLQDKIGENGSMLRREYALAVGMKEMRKKGFRVRREVSTVTKKPFMRATK